MNSSPIAAAVKQLELERANLLARLAKVDEAIDKLRDLFHLPAASTNPVAKVGVLSEDGSIEPGRDLREHDLTRDSSAITIAIRHALEKGPLSPGDLASKIGNVDRVQLRHQVDQLVQSGVLVSTGSTNARRIALAVSTGPKEVP
jgi:hypothetical protein